jgi:secondary thiamine-phosphate synthase enzyme
MWIQKEIGLKPKKRGVHLVTEEILRALPEIANFRVGLMNLFILHTSASLTINENADPSVRKDFETCFDRIAPEGDYLHSDEGEDDLPAHVKASLLGSSINIPVSHGRLRLGTWQGIYLCEHRNDGGPRRIVVTVHGE